MISVVNGADGEYRESKGVKNFFPYSKRVISASLSNVLLVFYLYPERKTGGDMLYLSRPYVLM